MDPHALPFEDGHDVQIGVDIVVRPALGELDEMIHTGRYFDNDERHFSNPHQYGIINSKFKEVVKGMDEILELLL